MRKQWHPDDPMYPPKCHATGLELIRRQAEHYRDTGPPGPHYHDWRECLCLLLIRATGKITKQELQQITGLHAYEVTEALQNAAMVDDIMRDGEYIAPCDTSNYPADENGRRAIMFDRPLTPALGSRSLRLRDAILDALLALNGSNLEPEIVTCAIGSLTRALNDLNWRQRASAPRRERAEP